MEEDTKRLRPRRRPRRHRRRRQRDAAETHTQEVHKNESKTSEDDAKGSGDPVPETREGTPEKGEVRIVARDHDCVDVQLVGGRIGLRLEWNDLQNSLVVATTDKPVHGLDSGAVLVSIDGDDLSGMTQDDALGLIRRGNTRSDASAPILRFRLASSEPLARSSNSGILATSANSSRDHPDNLERDATQSPIDLPQDKSTDEDDDSEGGEGDDDETHHENRYADETNPVVHDNQDAATPRGFEEYVARAIENAMRSSDVCMWRPGRGLIVFPRAAECKVTVLNRSIRAATRFYMGARRSAWRAVEKSSMSNALEVRIMKLDHAPLGIRKSLGWTKCFVGSFKTMQLAHRAVEEAMAKRDRGLIGVAPRPHPELCTSMQQTDLLLTHLEVRVESNNLASFNYSDKMAYVWHLLRYHCAVLDAFKMSESFHRVCKFTYIGPNVRALSVFTRLPLVASVSVKDQGRRRRPSAPLELSEKMRRRVGKDQSSIAQHRKRPATIKEMKKLVEDSGSDDEEDRAQGKRRFGHFFKGLSQDAQNLASQEALREEHRAIRDRTRRTPSSKPSRESKSTPSSDAPTRRRAVFSMRETSKEPIQMSMWVHRQEMRSAAIKLQRIFRGRAGPRIIRQEFRAEWHAIMAQRFVRGWIGRRRAEEWRILANSAAECVQRFWYMTLAQRRVRKIRRERVRLVLLLQPLVRGMMARKILAWRKRYDWAAKRIQSVMRGHRDRALFKRMLARKFHEDTVVPAAITIQRVGRGMLDRRVARMLRYEKHYAEVIVPSSIILQNLWRARVAQKRVAELRAQRFACTMLQRIIRGRLERKRFVGIVEWNARQQAATKIASVIRGWMAREICDWRRREHRRQFVEEPAAGQIQAAWRGLQTRRWFRHYVMKDAAVLVLQRTWRRVLARRKAREALDEMARAYMSKLATRLQAAFRGFRGRRRFRSLAQERDAQRLWATVVIQRQWRAVVRRAEKRRRREEIAREMHFLDLELLDIDVEEIQNDIKDVEEERHRILQYVRKSSKYRRKLKAARTEMEYRLPELELELNKLDLDDEETIPWQEAFESEIDQLSNILAMSEQELESKKLQVADMEEDAAELLMEIEDLQLDLEDTLQRRNTLIDEHRVRELRACAKAYRCDRENRIRTQRSRWKPKDVRRKIIARFRAEALPPLPPDVLHTSRMMLDRVASISVKKRQAYRRRDETTAQRLAFERQLTEMETRGVKEDALVRATYDGAVDGAKRVLQEYTYELRRPKHDIRADPRRVCQRCGLVLSACPCDDEE